MIWFLVSFLSFAVIYAWNTGTELKMKNSRLLTHQIAANFLLLLSSYRCFITCVQENKVIGWSDEKRNNHDEDDSVHYFQSIKIELLFLYSKGKDWMISQCSSTYYNVAHANIDWMLFWLHFLSWSSSFAFEWLTRLVDENKFDTLRIFVPDHF